jgi:membrane protease YdiL (CAAX protease family)
MITQWFTRIAIVDMVPPWSLLRAALVVGVMLVSLIIGTLIAFSLLEQAALASLVGWILGGLAAAGFIRAAFRQQRAALALTATGAHPFIVLLLAVGMAMLIDLIDLAVTGNFLPAAPLLVLRGADVGWVGGLAAVILMLLVRPLVEELVFRGILLPALRPVMGGWGGLLVSALLYGLFQALAYTTVPGDWWHTLITPMLMGLFLGIVRIHTGSTRAAIIAHVGFSIFALLKLLVLS